MAYGMNSPMSKEEAVTALHDLNAEHARTTIKSHRQFRSEVRTSLLLRNLDSGRLSKLRMALLSLTSPR